MAEIADYRAKQKLPVSIRHPDDYLSLIIDGPDQSVYSIPYFVEKSKNISSTPKVKPKFHEVIENGIGSWLYVVLMNTGNGCNMTMETLQRTGSDIEKCKKESTSSDLIFVAVQFHRTEQEQLSHVSAHGTGSSQRNPCRLSRCRSYL